jgi:hypothetical protein
MKTHEYKNGKFVEIVKEVVKEVVEEVVEEPK